MSIESNVVIFHFIQKNSDKQQFQRQENINVDLTYTENSSEMSLLTFTILIDIYLSPLSKEMEVNYISVYTYSMRLIDKLLAFKIATSNTLSLRSHCRSAVYNYKLTTLT